MLLKQFIPVSFLSLLFYFTERPVLAFSFNLPASEPDEPCTLISFYCASQAYTQENFGTVTTYIKTIESLPLGGTSDFLNLLNSSIWANQGWSFQSATVELAGNFNIGVYKPHAQYFPESAVGTDLQLLYQPIVGQDPVINIHWIQRVVSNHSIISTLVGPVNEGHGTTQDKIDVFEEQTNSLLPTFNPFYDTFSGNLKAFFSDFSTRPDIQENHDWYAELYLVQETALKTVTIYNGISWGWRNLFTPADPSDGGGDNGGGGSGGGGFNFADINYENADQQMLLANGDFDAGSSTLTNISSPHSSQTAEEVPEPATVAGTLLGLSALIGFKKLRSSQSFFVSVSLHLIRGAAVGAIYGQHQKSLLSC